jgi:hypothetical protein
MENSMAKKCRDEGEPPSFPLALFWTLWVFDEDFENQL